MMMVDIIYSNPGSPIVPVYQGKIDEFGVLQLVLVGEENIQDEIDSYAEDTCLPILIQRCAAGDVSGLQRVQGTYGDFVDMPKTFRDVLQSVIDGQAAFDQLPVDVKESFGNSFERWFSTIGEKEWVEGMKLSDVEPVKEEVKSE